MYLKIQKDIIRIRLLLACILSMFMPIGFIHAGSAKPQDNTVEIMAHENMMGRLYIPEAGINVAVYDCTGQTLEEKQKIVDDEDSAAYFKVGDVNLLADHNYQGFYKIQYAVPEKTAAFIQHGTTIDMYVCIENGVGINNKKRLIDANQNIIFEGEEKEICMYTCRENSTNIAYSRWRFAGTISE